MSDWLGAAAATSAADVKFSGAANAAGHAKMSGNAAQQRLNALKPLFRCYLRPFGLREGVPVVGAATAARRVLGERLKRGRVGIHKLPAHLNLLSNRASIALLSAAS